MSIVTGRRLNTFFNELNNIFSGRNYGVVSSGSGTYNVTVDGPFKLVEGAEVIIKFTIFNTSANPTLNVNNTGAKSMKYSGNNIVPGNLKQNGTYKFVYNGTEYDLIGELNTNYSIPGITVHYGISSDSITSDVRTVQTYSSGFTLERGVVVIVKFTTDNNGRSYIKLNVNSSGTKDVYYKGTTKINGYTLTSANRFLINKDDVKIFIYDGDNWQLVGDIDTSIKISVLKGTISIGPNIGDTSAASLFTYVAGSFGGGPVGDYQMLICPNIPYIQLSSISYAGSGYNVTAKRISKDANNSTANAGEAYVLMFVLD